MYRAKYLLSTDFLIKLFFMKMHQNCITLKYFHPYTHNTQCLLVANAAHEWSLLLIS